MAFQNPSLNGPRIYVFQKANRLSSFLHLQQFGKDSLKTNNIPFPLITSAAATVRRAITYFTMPVIENKLSLHKSAVYEQTAGSST